MTVSIWEFREKFERLVLKKRLNHLDSVRRSSFSPDDQFLITSDVSGGAKLWSLEGQMPEIFSTTVSPVDFYPCWFSDSKRFLVCTQVSRHFTTSICTLSHDQHRWKVTTTQKLSSDYYLTYPHMLNDDVSLGFLSRDRQYPPTAVSIIQLFQPDAKPVTLDQRCAVVGQSFIDDRYLLVNVRLNEPRKKGTQTLGSAFELRLWDLELRKHIKSYTGHVGISGVGSRLAKRNPSSCPGQCPIEGSDDEEMSTDEDEDYTLFMIHPACGGVGRSFIASGSEDGSILIWHRHHQILMKQLTGHEAMVSASYFHPTKHHLMASVSDDGTIRLWGK